MKKDKQELYQLYRVPRKDKGVNMPHIQVFEENYIHQADLLFLPDDDGYKYALVVVDLGNRLTDAEPLKSKSCESVKEAFERIYTRGILTTPSNLQVDPGSEFKGVTKKYFDKNDVHVRYGKPRRHRQQALVESRNKTIGAALMKRMTAEEILTGESSGHWVKDLPVVIKAMNKKFKRDINKVKPISDTIVCGGDSCNLLDEGQKVRVKLDEPTEYESEKRLHGNFRAGDIKWNPEIKTIDRVLLIPAYPPLYKLLEENQRHSKFSRFTKRRKLIIEYNIWLNGLVIQTKKIGHGNYVQVYWKMYLILLILLKRN